jgi:uncharacterized protein (TIGR02246 family)
MSNISISRTSSVFAMFLSLFLSGSSFAQDRQSQMNQAAAKELCTRLWSDYIDTVKTLDGVKIAAWFTKDAHLIYPNRDEIIGRDSIEAHLVSSFSGMKRIEFTFTLNHFDVIESKAYTFVTLTQLFVRDLNKQSEQPRQRARCALIWQRQADNTWKILHFLVNYFRPQA